MVLSAMIALAAVCHFSVDSPKELEATQLLLFPVFVCLLYFLPRAKHYAIPLSLLSCVFVAGLAFSLEIRGYIPLFTLQKGGLLVEFSTEGSSYLTRERYRDYNAIAKQYDFPALHLLSRNPTSAAEAKDLLGRQPQAIAIISGDLHWPNVSFDRDVSNYVFSNYSAKLEDQEKVLLTQLQLQELHDFVVVNVKDLRRNFALQVVPEEFKLPYERFDIANRLLGWTLKGLTTPLFASEANQAELVEIAAQQDAFLSASRVIGHWPSGAAKAAAGFLLAGSYLQEARLKVDGELQAGPLECAESEYGRAAGLTFARAEPQTYASIFNNAAVTLIHRAQTQADFEKAKSWLDRAMQVVDAQGNPVRAARLAVFNAMQLDGLGVL